MLRDLFQKNMAAGRTATRRRNRWLTVGGALLLLVVIALIFGRPARNAVKSWQARRHAAKAFALIDQEKWSEAKNEAVAAYQLRATEPEALRAVARFLSRTRQPQALDFWQQLAKEQPLTRDDLRDEASAALAAGEHARAEAAVAALLKDGATPRDWLLAAELATQKNLPAEAAEDLGKVLGSPAANEREQLQALMLQLASTASRTADPDRQREAWDRLKKLSTGTSSTALDALILLARHVLAAKPGETDAANIDVPALSHALETHPLAGTAQKLLALDLLEHNDPAQREALITRAIAQTNKSDLADLVTLAVWLSGKGEAQRELDTIPLQRALQSRELFLQHVDALGALGRWVEIRALLNAERFPLDPVVELMYLARCNAQLGEETAARNNWQRALEAAAGDSQKFMPLADYAERNGAHQVAEAAYTAAARENPKLRPAQQGRLRCAQAARDTRRMHAVLAEMLQLWPNDSAIQNDEAYTRLLLIGSPGQPPTGAPVADASPAPSDNEELVRIEHIAADLVQREPTSLPHRALLALAQLKQGRAVAALQAFEKIAVAPGNLTASALAVHAAVLAANGNLDGARSEAHQIPPSALLPEEQALIAGLLE